MTATRHSRCTNGERLLVIRTTNMECCTRCDQLRAAVQETQLDLLRLRRDCGCPDDCQRIEHPVICLAMASRTPEKIMYRRRSCAPAVSGPHIC